VGSVIAWYRTRNRLGDLSAAAGFLLPTVLILGVFTIYPILYSGYLSLHAWDGLTAAKPFVGFDNYVRLASSGVLGRSIWVTLYYAAGVTVGGLLLGLVAAVLIHWVGRGAAVYRSIYFLPAITATVAVAVVWKLLLDPGSGYVNTVLRSLGIIGPSWLRSPVWAMPAVIVVGVWKRLGFNTVVYLAGLQTIPHSIYEAAEVDGASRWNLFRRISVPMLAPTTLLLAIMSVIDSFMVFDQVFIMTGGGPIGHTEVLGLLLYKLAFRYLDLGGASAVGWVMFALIAGISLVQWRLSGSGSRGVGL